MKFSVCLISILVLSGCGSETYDSEGPVAREKTSSTSTRQNPANTKGKNAGVSSADASDGVDGNNPQLGDNDGPLAPVPVLGSYLVAVTVDSQGNVLSDASVNLEEDGLPSETGVSDSKGIVKLRFANADKISRLKFKRSGASASVSVLTLTPEDKVALLATVLREDDNVQVPPKILQIRADAISGQLAVTSIVNPQTDTTAPSVAGINTGSDGAGGKLVTINASDAQSGLNDTAYSFDGGLTWIASNQKSFPSGTSIPPGNLLVRDKAGNIAKVNSFTLGL
jgi:hypothetical protein